MQILPNLKYRYNVISIKISVGIFFAEISKLVLKFIWKYKRPKISKVITKKKNKAGKDIYN